VVEDRRKTSLDPPRKKKTDSLSLGKKKKVGEQKKDPGPPERGRRSRKATPRFFFGKKKTGEEKKTGREARKGKEGRSISCRRKPSISFGGAGREKGPFPVPGEKKRGERFFP